MRIEELNPEKFYVIIVENEHASTEDLNRVAERLRERGANAVVLTDNIRAVSLPQPSRYWGIWCAAANLKPGWLRDSSGRFFYYPSPLIAKAHLDDTGWEDCAVKEFTMSDVLEGKE